MSGRGLVRTKGGRVLRASDCSFASGVTSTALPWLWADTVSAHEVGGAVDQFGIKACQRCRPLDLALKQDAEVSR